MYYWVFRGLTQSTPMTLQALQRAVGTLRWYSAVVPMASTFELQRLLTDTQRRHKHKQSTGYNRRTFCTLTPAARCELEWWQWILRVNLHTPMLEAPAWYLANQPGQRPVISIYTDASTTVGGGYLIPAMTYGQFRWSREEQSLYGRGEKTDINGLEFVTAVCAIVANREKLRGTVVQLFIDNTSAVSWINKRRTSQLYGQSWIRCLISVALEYHLIIMCDYIPGVDNVHADALSRYVQDPATLQMQPLLSAESRQRIWSMSSTPREPREYLRLLNALETRDAAHSSESLESSGGSNPTSQASTAR